MVAPNTEISVHLGERLLLSQLLPPGEYLIGQASEAQIRFEAVGLADRHAMLNLRFNDWLVEDLEGSSGTYVNGDRITEPRLIYPSQKIRVGQATISLRRLRTDRTSSGAESIAPQTAAMQQLIPESLRGDRKYELGPIVGRGGMGVIVDAHELAVQRNVAMKLMLDCSAPAEIGRFVQEAQITAQLEHPNIVPVHELGVNELDQPFYTMKYVRGISLTRVLQLVRQGDPDTIQKYPLSTLLIVFQKMCDAIAFAHSRGILHRDLKPDNVMLGEYGEALVMDWGLAKVLGRESPFDVVAPLPPPAIDGFETSCGPTMVGTVLGTPQYMSPEQATGDVTTLRESTDIYALGAMLYHILTLEPPVKGKDSEEILAKVRAGQIAPMLSPRGEKRLPHVPGGRIPESLRAVALKAMSVDTAERYESVKDLQTDIAAYQNGFATTAEHASAWKLLGLFLRRHRTVSLAAALLLLAGIIFTIYLAQARTRAEQASKVAQAARRVADRQRDAAEDHLYLAHMLQAGRHLADGRPGSARELLLRHRTELSGRDLRDWEWFYLFGQLHQDRLRTLAHAGGVLALAASADGSRLVTAGASGDVAIWQARGLLPQARFPAHAGPVLTVAWHPAGLWVATAGADGSVRVWEAASGRKIAEWKGEAHRAVRSIGWKPDELGDGKLVIGSLGGAVQLWEPITGAAETLATLPNGVASLHWSADGQRLAIGALDTGNCIEVLDLPSRQTIFSSRPISGTDVFTVALDPTGKYVAGGSKHLTVFVHRVLNGERIFSEPIHRGFVSALAWSPDARQLASASHDGTIRIASPRESRSVPQILSGHLGEVNALAWVRVPALGEKAPPSDALFSGGADGMLCAWSPKLTESAPHAIVSDNWISAARWNADGTRVAVTTFRNQLHLIDPETGADTLIGPIDGSVFDAAWSPAGDRVALALRAKGLIDVREVSTGTSLATFPLARAGRVAWSRSGRYLAAASAAGVRAWDTTSPADFPLIDRPAGSVVWDPQEQRLVIGGTDGAVEVWDPFIGKRLAEWRAAQPPLLGAIPSDYEPPRQIFDLSWNPAGRLLAFATQDSVAGLLDGDDGRLVRTFTGHTSGIWRLAWNADGRRIATAGQDGTLRIFNALAGDQVAHISHGHGSSELHAVDWTADGRRILTGGYDKRVRVWDSRRGFQLDAVEQLERRLAGQPGHLPTLRELAASYARIGCVDRARATLARMRELAPADETVRAAAEEAELAFLKALD